jgi:hypothetical protein
VRSCKPSQTVGETQLLVRNYQVHQVQITEEDNMADERQSHQHEDRTSVEPHTGDGRKLEDLAPKVDSENVKGGLNPQPIPPGRT